MSNIWKMKMTVFRLIFRMPCYFKEVTHFYCPACGGTRSVKALLHFQIQRAFLCNPTVIYGVVIVIWCLIWMLAKKIFHKEIRILKPGLWMLVLGIFLFFGIDIIRNIMVYQVGYDYLGDLLKYQN